MAQSTSNTSKRGLRKEIIKNYPISALGATQYFDLGDLLSWNVISVQIAWTGVDGTFNGTFQLEQTNDRSLPFNVITGLTGSVNAAIGTETLESFEFGGQFARVAFSKGDATTGNLTIVRLLKDK